MTIVVAYKIAANPQDARVAPDGAVDWSRAKEALSDYDPVAIALGRSLADASGSELVGITVGPASINSPTLRKNVMARGLDRAVLVADDAVRDWPATQAGSALAGLAGRLDEVDLVITGDASVDEGVQLMPALIAGHLGWPCFLGVAAAEPITGGWRLTQAHEGGTRTVEVHGPAVISAAPDAIEPRTPGMKDILAAGKRPVEQLDLDALEVTPVAITVAGHRPAPVKERKHEVFSGDDAAAQLAAALRSAGAL